MDQISPVASEATYGAYLKALRIARGFTDPKLFAKAVYGDVEKPSVASQNSNIWNWETDRNTPRGPVLGKIANALNVSPHSINPKHFKPSWMNRLAIMKPLGPNTEDGYREEGGAPFVPNALLDSLPEEIRPGFGEPFNVYVKRMRELRGFDTAASLTSAMGTSPAVVSRVEKGLSVPTEETSQRLAETLDVPYALMDKSMFERLQEQGDEATETFGEYLSRLRRAAGYKTQATFAIAWSETYPDQNFDAAQQALSKWENGRALPSRTSAEKLAKMLGISAKTLDPKRFVPGRLLPPTLKIVEPELEPEAAAEEVDVETVTPQVEMLTNGMDIASSDVQWGGEQAMSDDQRLVSVREKFGNMPQFLKQHVDVFGVSKTDDPAYVRVRFDAILPRKTAGGLMRELVILTTDDLLGNGEE